MSHWDIRPWVNLTPSQPRSLLSKPLSKWFAGICANPPWWGTCTKATLLINRPVVGPGLEVVTSSGQFDHQDFATSPPTGDFGDVDPPGISVGSRPCCPRVYIRKNDFTPVVACCSI